MKKIFVFVLLFLGSTIGLVGASEVMHHGMGISGEESLNLWFHTPQYNQGSDTTTKGELSNNETSSSAYGELEVYHIQDGLDRTVCTVDGEVYASGDPLDCGESGSSVSGNVNEAWGRWTESSTSSVNTTLWIY